jgi:hypothetical protein
MGQDAPQIDTILYGRMKIAQFPAGALKISNQQSLGNGDRWTFSLGSANQTVKLTLFHPGSAGGQQQTLEGSLRLARPLKGSITERLTDKGCDRTIVIEQDNLVGASLTVTKSNVVNSFGGTLALVGGRLSIEANSEIEDRWGSLDGSITLATDRAKITGAKLRLPGAVQPQITIDLALAQAGQARLQLRLNSLTASVIAGSFATAPVVFNAPSGGAETTLAGVNIGFSSMRADRLSLTFGSHSSKLAIEKTTFTVTSINHAGTPRIRASSFTAPPPKIETVRGELQLKNGYLAVKDSTVVLEKLAFSAQKIEILNAGMAVLASGAGRVSVDSISNATIKGQLVLRAPRVLGGSPLASSVEVDNLSFAIDGAKQSALPIGRGEANALELGAMHVAPSGPKIPFTFSSDASGSLNVSFAPRPSSVTLGRTGSAQLKGATSNLSLRGLVQNPADPAQATLDVPPAGLSATLQLSQRNIALLGGSLAAERTISISNQSELRIGVPSWDQKLAISSPTVSLSGVQLKPTLLSNGIAIESAPQSAVPTSFDFNLDPAAANSFELAATFTLPGFELTPPAPAASITFQIGSFDVDAQSFKVTNVEIAVRLTDVEVALIDTSVALRHFEPHLDAGGQPPKPAQPDVRGTAATPLTIQKAYVKIPFTARPLEMAEMGLTNLGWEAQDITYRAVNGFSASAQRAKIELASLTKVSVTSTLTLSAASVAWLGAPNGFAKVDSIVIKLSGKPDKPSGTADLSINHLTLDGDVPIPIESGCKLNLVARAALTVRNISGTLTISEGAVTGRLNAADADTGTLRYAGDTSCTFDKAVTLRAHVCLVVVCVDKDIDLGQIRYQFAVYNINVTMKPTGIVFKVEDDGKKFRVCRWAVARLDPLPPDTAVVWKLAPITGLGGDIGRAINEAISAPLAVLETTFSGSLLGLYGLMSFTGFGTANPIADTCLQNV